MPKSATFTSPCSQTSTLPGRRSRWMTLLPVRVSRRRWRSGREVERPRQLERAFAHDDRLERLARDVLHDDEEDAFLLLGGEDRDDVGMAQAAEQAGLVQQLAEVEVLLTVRDLDGDLLVEPRVFGEEDGAEAAAAQRREDSCTCRRVCPRKNTARSITGAAVPRGGGAEGASGAAVVRCYWCCGCVGCCVSHVGRGFSPAAAGGPKGPPYMRNIAEHRSTAAFR